MNSQTKHSTQGDWKDLWAQARGAHAAVGSYSARCLASGGRAAEEDDGERVAIDLCYAAGQRLRFQTDDAQAGTTDSARAGVVIWGHAQNYFAWRPGAGLESLGSDVEIARKRCGLIAPRVGELLQLLAGRDLHSASPLAARPDEVKVSRLKRDTLLNWRSADGTTLWQAKLRGRDSALLSLRSDVDGSFDVARALEHASSSTATRATTSVSARTERTEEDWRARLEGILLEERDRASWSELCVEPRLEAKFDEDVFLFAPPA